MSGSVHCFGCNSTLRYTEKLLGKTVRCPKCNHEITIPKTDDVDEYQLAPVNEPKASQPAPPANPVPQRTAPQSATHPNTATASGAVPPATTTGAAISSDAPRTDPKLGQWITKCGPKAKPSMFGLVILIVFMFVGICCVVVGVAVTPSAEAKEAISSLLVVEL